MHAHIFFCLSLLQALRHSSIFQWNNCLDIVMSIYLSKIPDMAIQLLKNAYMIRNMSAKVGFESTRFYDEDFRKLYATHVVIW